MNNSANQTSFFNWPLLALGLGAFGIGTTEFAPMGLLPSIADGIEVSIPVAGSIVTAYAIGVMISAPLMTLLFNRYSQRTALILLMGIFIVGNLLSAMAPGYLSLVMARVITSLSQGAFFGIGAVVATLVVPKEKQASAVATMFMGLSIANIVGVPAATWLGQAVGWRQSFGVTAVLGVVALIGLALALPKGQVNTPANVRQEVRALLNLEMLITMGMTVSFAAAFFTLYTYVAPFLQSEIGASGEFITVALVLIGTGLTFGNWAGGKLADWSLDGAMIIGLGALAATMLLIPVVVETTTGAAMALTLWAVAAFISVPALQVRAMRAASGAPSLAAAINIAGFNLGNAIGASVGAGVIGAGFHYESVSLAGGLLAAVGIVLLGVSRLRSTRVSEAITAPANPVVD